MDSARTFESIVIIFNPNSTGGDAPELAQQLHDRLKEMLTYQPEITLQPRSTPGMQWTWHAKRPQRAATSWWSR